MKNPFPSPPPAVSREQEYLAQIQGHGKGSRPLYVPPAEVVVTDFKMPFDSMILFMIKWGLAAIAAFLIVGGCVFGFFFGLAELARLVEAAWGKAK